jgi:YfiR/HmsC-like
MHHLRFIAIHVRWVMIVIGLCAAATESRSAHALSNEEWVMAFVRFIDWPAPNAEKTLVVCHPADSPALELDGQLVRGLTVRVQRIMRPQEIESCQVFAAMAQREADWPLWLAAIAQKPVLAVGSGARYCELGGTICLLPRDAQSVEKYRLNLDSLARAGLRVRSQLLRPSRARDGVVE